MIDMGDGWRQFFNDTYRVLSRPVGPRWCNHEAIGLATGRITVVSKPGKLHPRALDPKWVRL